MSQVGSGKLRNRALSLDYARPLLDVVFGVIIGLAINGLARLVHASLGAPFPQAAMSPLLISSALVFASCYWLKTREFMDEQQRFEQALLGIEKPQQGQINLSLSTFLLGGLCMAGLAAAFLEFASYGDYVLLSIAGLSFWACDVGGTFFLRQTYSSKQEDVGRLGEADADSVIWFKGHIKSRFFYLYGIGNGLPFIILLCVASFLNQNMWARFAAAASLLAFTLFSQLLWRTRIYAWWTSLGDHPANTTEGDIATHASPEQALKHQVGEVVKALQSALEELQAISDDLAQTPGEQEGESNA